MSQSSSRLALPYLQPQQAQKHVTHNEALQRLDYLTQLTVVEYDAVTPPVTPQEGEVWALGATASGVWSGQGGKLAGWFNGGWLFIAPQEGWRAARGADLRIWTGTEWRTPAGPEPQNLVGVGINAESDLVNRLAVSADATLLTHEGAGHQLKINKAAETDTASLLFQTAFSGRAEMGTAGADDFAIKVSADGAAWSEAMRVRAVDGRAAFPSGAGIADGSAAAPSLGFLSETGTGLYRSGAKSLGIAIDGQERMRIADGGVRIDGAVIGAAVTQSATDMTAGRLVKTGDFGLGDAIALTAADNLNMLTVAGLFYNPTSGNCANNNYPIFSAGVLVNQRRTNTNWAQQFISYGGDSTVGAIRQFTRSYGALGWTPWSEVIHQGRLVGPVSQSGGMPTGCVIERGSNANGSYMRWADGTQICTLRRSVSTAIATGHLGGFRSGNEVWVYPAQFAVGTLPVMSGAALDGTAISVVFPGGATAQQAAWSVTAITSQSAATRTVTMSAIGRWF
ncbi:DUF2793 domain-containing protein [Roseovarius aquimarinus]|uniref:DUF2793 domain-containing protein n=1 Tax=Roseovarius aquimarinus TaxID=1229156 RepID=A0ABW7ICM4_9RHOB